MDEDSWLKILYPRKHLCRRSSTEMRVKVDPLNHQSCFKVLHRNKSKCVDHQSCSRSFIGLKVKIHPLNHHSCLRPSNEMKVQGDPFTEMKFKMDTLNHHWCQLGGGKLGEDLHRDSDDLGEEAEWGCDLCEGVGQEGGD